MKSAFLRRLSLTACALSAVACSNPATPKPATAAATPSTGLTDDQKTLYAMGFIAGGNFAQFKLSPEEFATVMKGMEASATGKKSEVDVAVYQPRIDPFLQAKIAQAKVANVGKAQERRIADAEIAVQAAKEPGAKPLPSGGVLLTLKAGSGAQPPANGRVRVHYEGKLKDGTVFDSSIKRGQPVEFALNEVISCWREGVGMMKIGEKAKLTCPSNTAYGDDGREPVIPPGATLIFEVELLGIAK